LGNPDRGTFTIIRSLCNTPQACVPTDLIMLSYILSLLHTIYSGAPGAHFDNCCDQPSLHRVSSCRGSRLQWPLSCFLSSSLILQMQVCFLAPDSSTAHQFFHNQKFNICPSFNKNVQFFSRPCSYIYLIFIVLSLLSHETNLRGFPHF